MIPNNISISIQKWMPVSNTQAIIKHIHFCLVIRNKNLRKFYIIRVIATLGNKLLNASILYNIYEQILNNNFLGISTLQNRKKF